MNTIPQSKSADARATMPVTPVAVFLAAQAGSLALSVAGVPFSAAFVKPAEVAAAHQLLVIDGILITLLFPWLCGTARSAAVAATGLWPMLVLSALLAGLPAADIAAPGLFLTTWMFCLMLLSYILRSGRSRLIGLAIAAGCCAAGPLAWYLRAEFAENPTPIPHWLAGPLQGAILLLTHNADWRVWIPSVIAIVVTSVLAIGYRTAKPSVPCAG